MPMCVNENGSTNLHLPSWFTKEIVLNEFIKDMESRMKGDSFVPSLNRKYTKKKCTETLLSQLLIIVTI